MRSESELQEAFEEIEEVIEKGKNPNQEYCSGQKNALYWALEKDKE